MPPFRLTDRPFNPSILQRRAAANAQDAAAKADLIRKFAKIWREIRHMPPDTRCSPTMRTNATGRNAHIDTNAEG